MDEWEEWQSRPLDAVYPVIFIDSLTVKAREGAVSSWPGAGSGESRDFWLTMLGELKARGIADACVVCCDHKSGLPEAIGTVWPQAVVQVSVIRLIRACRRYATRRDLPQLAKSLRAIHSAADEAAATAEFEAFAEAWDGRYPATVKLWRSHWSDFARLWRFSADIRRLIHGTSQIEVMNNALHKVVRQHGYFTTAQAALATLYLTLQEAQLEVSAQVPNWKPALQALTIAFDGRLPTP